MKTDNIWTVVILHYLANSMTRIFMGESSEPSNDSSITWIVVGLMAIIMLVCFAWPILTKFFRN